MKPTIADVDRALMLRGKIAALKAETAVYEDALATLNAPLPPVPPPLQKDVAEHDPPFRDPLQCIKDGTCDWNACGRPLTSPPAPLCGSPERHEGGCC